MSAVPQPSSERRKCGRCGHVGPRETDFYPSDPKRCKTCHLAASRASRERHREDRLRADRERHRQYLRDPERKAAILARQKEQRRAKAAERRAALSAALRAELRRVRPWVGCEFPA